jgi:hypothetical protein
MNEKRKKMKSKKMKEIERELEQLNSQSFLKIKVERMKEIVKRIEKLRIE